jgi:7-cyano-7-deazaguanine synthase
VLLSGGIDSATCLYMIKGKYAMRALTFEYHGIARRELEAAKALASAAEVSEHRIVRLPDLREAEDIEGRSFPELPPTYIPMRNSIFYSFAASYAEEVGASRIVGGHNSDDAKVFRDVRPRFFRAMQEAFRAGSELLAERETKVLRPLSRKTKSEVIRRARDLGVPLELTWSCHRDGPTHCWSCAGCRTRVASFRRAGVPDPLRAFGRGKLLKE